MWWLCSFSLYVLILKVSLIGFGVCCMNWVICMGLKDRSFERLILWR